jgi:hypothetical protein
MIKKFSLFLIFTSAFYLGCAPSDKGGSTEVGACTSGTAPTFSSVSNIFTQNCDGCHGHQFSVYANAITAASSIYSEVTAKRMPQGSSLSSADLSAIQQWIACGSKQ